MRADRQKTQDTRIDHDRVEVLNPNNQRPICPVMAIRNLSGPDEEGDVHLTIGGRSCYLHDPKGELYTGQLVLVLPGDITIAAALAPHLIADPNFSNAPAIIPLSRLTDSAGQEYWVLPGGENDPTCHRRLLQLGDDAGADIDARFIREPVLEAEPGHDEQEPQNQPKNEC